MLSIAPQTLPLRRHILCLNEAKNYTYSRQHYLKGFTVELTFCLFCLDSAALGMLNEQPVLLFGQIQTSQTRGQPYSDSSPNGLMFFAYSIVPTSRWCIPKLN